jgi:hypothetical protein
MRERGVGKEIDGHREEFVGKGELPSDVLIATNPQDRAIRQSEGD